MALQQHQDGLRAVVDGLNRLFQDFEFDDWQDRAKDFAAAQGAVGRGLAAQFQRRHRVG